MRSAVQGLQLRRDCPLRGGEAERPSKRTPSASVSPDTPLFRHLVLPIIAQLKAYTSTSPAQDWWTFTTYQRAGMALSLRMHLAVARAHHVLQMHWFPNLVENIGNGGC